MDITLSALVETLATAYGDARFWSVGIATVAISMAAFAFFAAPLTWLAAHRTRWAERYRIPNTRGAQLSDDEAERRNILIQGQRMVRLSVRQWLINNLWMLLVVVTAWPLMQFAPIHGGPLPAWWVIPLQLLFCIYLDDFLYYWMHRSMHQRFLLKHVHGLHHRVLAPWAITGHYMHPIEYVLTGSIAFIGPAVLGSHIVVLWIWIVFRQWEAAEGHAGYAFPWSPTHWLPGSDGALHHDYHHARVRGNYGGFMPIWDRAFGTTVAQYDDALARWKQRRRGIGNAAG